MPSVFALVERPLETTDRFEPFDERVLQREQVLDVGGGVDLLLRGQGATGPVGEPVALAEARAEHPLDQRDEGRRTEPDEAGRDLRVEQVGGTVAAQTGEDREVLLGRVRHEDARAFEQRRETRRVDRERIDERDAVAPRDLDQREPGPVRTFAVELGVEAEPGLLGDLRDEVVERSLVSDPPGFHTPILPVAAARARPRGVRRSAAPRSGRRRGDAR